MSSIRLVSAESANAKNIDDRARQKLHRFPGVPENSAIGS